MAISKRELELSQDLMELQSRYNRLNMENNRITTLLRKSMEASKLLSDSCDVLQSRISVLESISPKINSVVAKKYSTKNK